MAMYKNEFVFQGKAVGKVGDQKQFVAEKLFTQNGVANTEFYINVPKKVKNQDGTQAWKDRHFKFKVWKDLVDVVVGLNPGQLVEVTGFHDVDEWTDKTTKQPRRANKLVAMKVVPQTEQAQPVA